MKHQNRFLCSLLPMLFVGVFASMQARAGAPELLKSSGFIQNNGQWGNDFSYVTKNGNLSTWITRTGLVFDVRGEAYATGKMVSSPSKFRSLTNELVPEMMIPHHAFAVHFNGASAQAFEPQGQLEGSYSYLKGANDQAWVKQVPHFTAVTMKNVYPGVDALVTTVDHAPQYNFVVAPFASPDVISLSIDGAQSVSTNASGELVIKTTCGDVRNGALFAYQEVQGVKRQVPCSFVVNGNNVRFAVASYDRSRALIIDPIVYATFIGGDDMDEVTSSVRNPANGELIVVGFTNSSNFPKTTGAYVSPASGAEDAFVAKFDSKLSKMVFAAYVGGASTDKPWDVALARNDGTNDIFVTGETSSANFPTKSGSYKQTQQGGVDAFVFRMNSAGTDLKYSTYFGGAAGDDRAYSIGISASNQVLICGVTNSNNMPTTSSVLYKTSLGGTDGFVARIGTTGGTLEYATYYGGNGNDRCTAIGMTNSLDNVAFITGETVSGNLPLFPTETTGWPNPTTRILAPQRTIGGASDAFFARFNNGGTKLDYSTYFGGNGVDFATTILVDAAGGVRIGGGTTSSNLNLIKSYQATKKAGQECLLAGIDTKGTAFNLAAYHGGAGDDCILDMATDDGTNLFIAGRTTSNDYPSTDDAFQKNYQTGTDGFLTKLAADMSPKYSTYIGSKGTDSMLTVEVIDGQQAYVGGIVSGTTMAVTDSAAGKTATGPSEGWLAKFTFSSVAISTPPAGEKKCAGQPVAISWFASNPEVSDKYTIEYSGDGGLTWNFIKKDVTGTSSNWTLPVTLPGGSKYRIRLINQLTMYSVMNPGEFTVLAAPGVSSTAGDTTICAGESTTVSVVATGDNLSYQWRRGGQAIAGATSMSYTITNATSADSAAFDCVVTGTCAPPKTSPAIMVKVSRGATITKEPANVTVNAGQSARFEVVADGKNLSYRWQRDGNSIPGATASVYEFFAQNQDKGQYRCIVSGDCGSDTSAAAVLDISTSVDEWVDSEGMLRISRLSPNPVSDMALIEVQTQYALPVELSVINTLGRVVYSAHSTQVLGSNGTATHTIQFPSNGLADGAYRVIVSCGSKRVAAPVVIRR